MIAHTPALLPAAAVWLGAWLAFRMAVLPVLVLAVLVVLGLCLGRSWSRGAAFVALGMLATGVGEGLPAGPVGIGVDSARPVIAVVRPVEQPRVARFSWSVPAHVLRLRQGREVVTSPAVGVVRLYLPEPEVPFPAGSLRVRGYLKPWVGFANGGEPSAGPLRLTVKSRRLVEVEEEPAAWQRLSRRLRVGVRESFRTTMELAVDPDSPGVALARALVLGEREAVPDPWRRALERHGLAHLLAVSGLHVGMVALLAWLPVALLPSQFTRWRWIRLLPPALAVGLYLLLVGPRPSLLRASAMALLALTALALKRPPSAGNALAVFVLGVVLLRPSLVLDLGFCLSVAATGALVWLTPLLVAGWGAEGAGGWEAGKALRRWLAATTAAQLGTLPWALPTFHLLTPSAPLANLLAVPWAALMLGASLLWTGLAWLSPPLALGLVPLLDGLAAPVAWLTAAPTNWGSWGLGALPWVSLPGTGLSPWAAATLLAAALLAALLRVRRGVPLLALALLLGQCGVAFPRSADPELILFDVGQGDAVLLKDGPRAVLVDGGTAFAGRSLLPALAAVGVYRLEAMVLTHPDADHCGGLAVLADLLPVARVYLAAGERDRALGNCGRWLAALPTPGPQGLTPGDLLTVGRWRVEVLHPSREEGDAKDNDRSLVLRALTPSGQRILLTGDIEATAERRLLKKPDALACEVLKVAHHGSHSSSTPAFLRAAAPRLALVSVGRGNPYGHPASKTLRRLGRHGIHSLRTDHHGRIRLLFPRSGRLVLETAAAPTLAGTRLE